MSEARDAIEAVEKGSLGQANLALVLREAKVLQSVRDIIDNNIQTEILEDDQSEEATV